MIWCEKFKQQNRARFCTTRRIPSRTPTRPPNMIPSLHHFCSSCSLLHPLLFTKRVSIWRCSHQIVIILLSLCHWQSQSGIIPLKNFQRSEYTWEFDVFSSASQMKVMRHQTISIMTFEFSQIILSRSFFFLQWIYIWMRFHTYIFTYLHTLGSASMSVSTSTSRVSMRFQTVSELIQIWERIQMSKSHLSASKSGCGARVYCRENILIH